MALPNKLFVVQFSAWCNVLCTEEYQPRKRKGFQDPEVQLRQPRKFASTQKWEIAAEFADEDSGAKSNRPQFKKMMEAASKREFDVKEAMERYAAAQGQKKLRRVK